MENGMKAMYLAMGYRCNHHCYFCPCGKEENKVPAASVEQMKEAIAAGIRENGIEYITLSGGEPTMHPGFHEVLGYCAEQKLRITVLSNGDNFYKESNVHRYFDGIDPRQFTITTAIHSHFPGLHDRVTGVPGSHARTVQGMKNLIPMRIPFTVKQVISKWNYRYLPDFVDFVFREYGSYASLTLCGMDFCGMDGVQIGEVGVPYKELGPYLEQALDQVLSIRRKYGGFPMVSVADLPLCCVDPYYWGFFAKVSRGSVEKYSAPVSGNADGLDEEVAGGLCMADPAHAANGKFMSAENIVNDCDIYFDGCKRCCAAEWCPGVWSTAWNYFGESAVSPVLPVKESIRF